MCRRFSRLVLAFAPWMGVGGGAALPASGASFTWSGLGANAQYATTSNWSPTGRPVFGDQVTFATGFNSGFNITLTQTTGALAFTNSATSSFTLSPQGGSTAIRYQLGDVFQQSSIGTLTIAAAVELAQTAPQMNIAAGAVVLTGGVNPLATTGRMTITKSGAGTLTVGGNYDRTNFVVSGGSLQLTAGSVSNASVGTASIELADLTTLNLSAGVSLTHTVRPTVGTGVRNFNISNGAFTSTLASIAGGRDDVLNLTATGTGSVLQVAASTALTVAKHGTGTLELPGSTAAGPNQLNASVFGGTLQFTSAVANIETVLTGGTTLVFAGAAVNSVATLANSGVNTVDTGTSALTLAGGVDGSGTIMKVGTGELVVGLGGPSRPAGYEVRAGTLNLGATFCHGAVGLAGGTVVAVDPDRLVAGVNTGTLGGTVVFTGTSGGTLSGLTGAGPVSLRGPNPATAGTTLAVSYVADPGFTGALALGTVDGLAPIKVMTPLGLGGGTGMVTINSGSALVAAGLVQVHVTGLGTVTASGNLTVGVAEADGGYVFPGTLEVGSNSVTLASLNHAVLGARTTITAGGSLASTNGISVGVGSTVAAAGNAVLSGQVVNAGAVTVTAGRLTLTGDVSGSGSFAGTTLFTGSLNPAGNFGAATSTGPIVLGNVELGGTNRLVLELGGFARESYDSLTATTVALGGILDIRLVGGYEPSFFPTSFSLISAGSITGSFSQVLLPTTQFGTWSLRQTPTSLELDHFVVVPEPTGGLLGGVVVGLMAGVRGRRVRTK